MTTITQAITPLPTAPDPATMTTDQFSTAAAASVLAQKSMAVELETFRGQLNTVAGEVNTNATTASSAASTATTQAGTATTAASTATTQAGIATTKAAEAAASAATAAEATAFLDSNPIVKGSADATKMVRMEVDGLTTATTRVITVPDEDITLFGKAGQFNTSLKVIAKGNSGTTTQTYDYSAGHVQTSTATGNHTIDFSNWPATGNRGIIKIKGANFGAYTLTWPTINWVKPDGTTTTSVNTWLASWTGRTAFQTSGVDELIFWTDDGGTTIYGTFGA